MGVGIFNVPNYRNRKEPLRMKTGWKGNALYPNLIDESGKKRIGTFKGFEFILTHFSFVFSRSLLGNSSCKATVHYSGLGMGITLNLETGYPG